MTIVSNDPSWWPFIASNVFLSYWIIAAGLVVVYDWALTLGQEIELIWRQRWSLITVLYLVTRYIGIPYSIMSVLETMTLVSLTDAGCVIIYYAIYVAIVVIGVMLCVIMIARLHVMYQRSRMMLMFLVIIFLAVTIASGVMTAMVLKDSVLEEATLSGTYICHYEYVGDVNLLLSMLWMLYTVWEVLALCLSVWIAGKHFRDLRRFGLSTGSTVKDCFRVLMQSHVLYFASFFGASFLQFITYSPLAELANPYSMGYQILNGAAQILFSVQAFVLGPRLILSIREYHAKLVAESDAEISMNSIVFQKRVHVPTSSTV